MVAISSGSVVGKQAFLTTPRSATFMPKRWMLLFSLWNLDIRTCTLYRSEGGGKGLALTLVEDR